MTPAKKGGDATSERGNDLVTVSKHPRARRQVRLAKGWGGLAGFAIVAAVGLRSGLPAPELALRAVLGGVAAYLVVWACAVYAWRQLVVAEAHAEWKRLMDRSRDGEAGGDQSSRGAAR